MVPEISVVIAVYGCAPCLRSLYQRLTAVLEPMRLPYEIVFVDDRSPDGAWETLVQLAHEDPRIRLVRLSRNWGQHAAVTAGLTASQGQWTVVMDCDLQDPPEEIPRLYAKAIEGFEVVLTRRDERKQSLHRRLAARAYFRLREKFLGIQMDAEYSMLSIVSRKVVDAFLTLGDRDRQYMLILHWLGFPRAVLEIEHAERHEGKSSYTFRMLIRVGLDGMFFQTATLLRWIVYAGFGVAVCGMALAVYLVYRYFVTDPLPGWTSVAVLVLLLSGTILVALGVTGLYVGKIFEQVKGRPLFVVDTVLPDPVVHAHEAPHLSDEVRAAGVIAGGHALPLADLGPRLKTQERDDA
jgi:glycosyltransferase involved in cell wall biosynthesis